MRDVRLYLRDALREYAAVQAFRPRRSEYARCYTGAAGVHAAEHCACMAHCRHY